MNTTRTGVFKMIYHMNTSCDVLVGRSASLLRHVWKFSETSVFFFATVMSFLSKLFEI